MQTAKSNLANSVFGFKHLLESLLFPLLLAILTLKAFLFFSQAWRTIIYPYEWSTMDGYYVFYGLRLLSGKPIYFDYQTLLTPFEYAPVYPAVIGALARLFGIGVWYERTFSLVCALGMAAVIVRAVIRHSSTRWAGACAGALFFAPASLSVWYLVRGIDILSAFLTLGAVAAAADSEGKTRRIYAATLLFVLAFFTKQTAIFGAGAIILYLTVERRWAHLLTFAGGSVILSSFFFFLLQRASGGWFFENAFLMTSNNPYYVRLFLDLIAKFALLLLIALPLAVLEAVMKARSPQKIWSFYFFCACASTLLAAKAGAALSYFIPVFSAICVLAGLCLGDQEFKKARPAAYTAILALLLLQAGWFFREENPAPSKADYTAAVALDSLIKERPGPILIERIDSFAMRNGRELSVEAVQLPILIMRRKFDPDIIIEAVNRKHFSLIIYSGVYFGGSPAIKKAIFENYQAIDEVEVGLFFGKMKFLVLAPV